MAVLRICLGLSIVVLLLAAPAAGAAQSGAVTVWDRSGKQPVRCPDVDASDPLNLRGGCLVDMFSSEFDIDIRSVVGDMDFATCTYEHDMRIDGAGHTYLEGITSGGPTPCADLGVCDHRKEQPWLGRIKAQPDGKLAHVVDACLDTCMGRFSGKLELDLRRVGRGWRQTADGVLVGDSGYRFDGDWRMDERGADIDIRPDGSAGNDAAGLWLGPLARDPVGWPI